jgi:transcriptional regulator
MEIVEDPKVIFDSLNDMVKKYENPDSPYNLSDVDPNFIKGMSKGIVAFRINISKIEAKAKLSQNHPVERQELIINQLEQIPNTDDQKISILMKANLKI